MTTNTESLVMKSVILTAEQLAEMSFHDVLEQYGFVLKTHEDHGLAGYEKSYTLQIGNDLLTCGMWDDGEDDCLTISANGKTVFVADKSSKNEDYYRQDVARLQGFLQHLPTKETRMVDTAAVAAPVVFKNLKRMSMETLAKMVKVPGLVMCHGWTRNYANKHGEEAVMNAIKLEIKERVTALSYVPVDVAYTERTEDEQQLLSAFKVAKTAMFAGSIMDFLSTQWNKDSTLSDVVRVFRNAYLDKDAKVQADKTYKLHSAIEILNRNGNFEAEELTRESAISLMRLKKIAKPGSFSKLGVDVRLCSAGVIVRPTEGGVVGVRCLTTTLLGAEYFTEEMYSKVMTQVVVLNAVNKVIKFDKQYLTKVAMLKKYKISLDGLGYGVKLVLRFDTVTNKAGDVVGYSLAPVAFPAIVLKRENVCGFMEPEKSARGFINTDVLTYPNLADRISDGVYLSTEDAKKFCARQEKLNKDRDVFKTTMSVYFIKDVPASLSAVFNTGCIYAPESWIIKHGACRVVSSVDNGLIKGATHLAPLIDAAIGQEYGFVAASSYKGKLNGVMRAAGMEFDLAAGGIRVPDGFWDQLTLTDGTVLDVKLCTIELLVTNPYAVERFFEQSEEEANNIGEADELSLEKSVARNGFKANNAAVSMDILQSVNDSGSLLAEITSRADEGLAAKGTLSTVTSSEFEVVRNTYGRDVALQWMDCVVNSSVNKSTAAKKARGIAVLTGEYEVVKTLPLIDMLNTLVALADAYDVELGVGSAYTSAPRNFLLSFVEAIGANIPSNSAWIAVTHGNTTVHIPTGTHLYGGLVKSSSTKDSIVVEGMIGKLLAILDNASKFGTLTADVAFRALDSLQYEVQWKFVNKNFGKMVVKGNYFVLLPGFWLQNKYDVCMPARDTYMPKHAGRDYVTANIAKHPLYFFESVAGCHVYRDIPGYAMTEEMAIAMAPVLFVHPDYLLEMQNDADGDQARVSFDKYVLPLYGNTVVGADENGVEVRDSMVMHNIAKAFHQGYITKENDLSTGDTQAVKTWDSRALHVALVEANTSKVNVGLFTDLAQKVAASIDATCGNSIDEATRRQVVAVMFILIQECAMNAIKHNGNAHGMTVADSLCSINLMEFDKVTRQKVGVIRAIAMVSEYLAGAKYDVDAKSFAKTLVACVVRVHLMGNDLPRKVFKDMPTDWEAPSGFLDLESTYNVNALAMVDENDSMSRHLLAKVFVMSQGEV